MPLTIWDFSSDEYFWQYPVITERQVLTSLQQLPVNARDARTEYVYLGVPWATVIDLNIYCRDHLEDRVRQLTSQITHRQREFELQHPNSVTIYLTACQHIFFTRIISVLKRLRVAILFASHKPLGTDSVDSIQLRPLQLYAVNLEDPARNQSFCTAKQAFGNTDLLRVERPLLYSFVGFYSKNYLTRVRQYLLRMTHPENCLVKSTDKWHFVDTVYRDQTRVYPQLNTASQQTSKQQAATRVEHYNQLLLSSRYSLCPSGSGPNSIRLWESLGAGAIPVILADTLDLPAIPSGLDWHQVVVRVPERQVTRLAAILRDISPDTEHMMRQNCLSVYREFSGSQFARHIVETL